MNNERAESFGSINVSLMEYKDMTTYKEGLQYTLSLDYYTNVTLLCTFVEDNFAYLFDTHKEINYKKNLKTQKLYVFNTRCQSWDTVEESIRPLSDHDCHSTVFAAMSDFKGD